jgi:hypothetical protein
MPYRDKKMYKNPRLPKAAELQATQGETRDRKDPMAPQRGGGGMLQMAAQARTRQPKEGAPPIPTAVAPGPATPPAPSLDARAMAARRISEKPIGSFKAGGKVPETGAYQLHEGETVLPVAQKKEEPAAVADPYATPEGGTAGGPIGGAAPSTPGLGMETKVPAKPITPSPADVPGGTPDVGLGPLTPMSGTPWSLPGTGVPTDTTPEGEGMPIGEVPGTGLPLDTKPAAVADPYATPEGGAAGAPITKATDVWKPGDKYKGEKYAAMEKYFMDYLNQATGIPPEELQGQIAGLESAGFDQMAKFAQMMASRGMSVSGVTGQGMGQIMTQTMLGIANLRFENSKLAVEERMNKIKNFMAFYGNVMSEENKKEHLDFLEKLEQDKFNYDKEQNLLSDKWVAVKNLLALSGSEQWDTDALGWAFRAIDAGADPSLITEWIYNDGKTVKIKPGAPEYPGVGDVGPPPEGGTSAAPKNSFTDYLSDEQYEQYFEYGQVPTEHGWKDEEDSPFGGKGAGLKWAEMSGAQKTMAMSLMKGLEQGWPDAPPGWQDKYPDNNWNDLDEGYRGSTWNAYVIGGGGDAQTFGQKIWFQITGYEDWISYWGAQG